MEPEALADFLPVLCDSDPEAAEREIRRILEARRQIPSENPQIRPKV